MSNSRTRLVQKARSSDIPTLFEPALRSARPEASLTPWRSPSTRTIGRTLLLAGALLLVSADLVLGVAMAINGGTGQGQLLWNWSHLFSLPLICVLGGLWYARNAAQRARLLAEDAQQEQLLYAYLDRMSSLSPTEESEINILAKAWTVLALRRLDGERKGLIVRFLCESTLLQQQLSGNLQGFDLKDADLSQLHLSQVNLAEADLRGSNLSGADLSCADLKQADLGGAHLHGANLGGADLNGAILDKVDLRGADLSNAELRGAILDGANLHGANLSGAVLDTATLLHATFSAQQLEKARSTIGLLS